MSILDRENLTPGFSELLNDLLLAALQLESASLSNLTAQSSQVLLSAPTDDLFTHCLTDKLGNTCGLLSLLGCCDFFVEILG